MAVAVVGFCLVATLLSFLAGDTMAIRIEINPKTYDSIAKDTVHITCTMDDKRREMKTFMTIHLLKDDKPIVVLSKGHGLLPSGNDARFKVQGSVGQDINKSFIKLTIENTKREDSGRYTCVLNYLNPIYVLKTERSSQNLVEKKLDMGKLEQLAQELKGKISILKDNITRLQSVNRPAFSAYKKSGTLNPVRGQILVFPDFIMNLGQGYNQKTGIFTAPMPGVYVFHLLLQLAQSRAVIYVEIKTTTVMQGKTSTKILGSLEASDYNYWGQTSITGVAELKTGDQVMPVVADDKTVSATLVRVTTFTTFSGYLLYST